MRNSTKLSVLLAAAGLVTAALPAHAQTSDLDGLKQKVQELSAKVDELQKKQKDVATLGGLTAVVGGGTITLYGDLDVYANHMTSSSGQTINAFEDGAILRSRWGLKGEKPMGNGYAMKFTLEGGFNGVNGQAADLASNNTTLNATYGGRLFDRQAWVGFLTPVGEFRFGRQNTTIFFKGA
jgi:predicted porin